MVDDMENGGLIGPERRRRRLFRQRKIPVRFLVPNFFTLLSLCAGVTAIRMGIEAKYDLAVALIVAAALLDGVDGRLARALKAQSRFGAELDSLADFINFGVAPVIVVFTWGLGGIKGLGWIAALVFSCGMALRLARFNAMLDVDKPKWQSNYFTGIPAPAGAVTVLLPLYLEGIGLVDMRQWPLAVSAYTIAMASLLVSTLPTFSGKLMGERISREWVLPLLVVAASLVGFLVTYPYPTLTVLTLVYLGMIPISYRRFAWHQKQWDAEVARHGGAPADAATAATPAVAHGMPRDLPSGDPGPTRH
ncbi:MAG: phosphatidylcholine/phosphatidylserine synthase [Hyphomicrobiaceae bacterium]